MVGGVLSGNAGVLQLEILVGQVAGITKLLSGGNHHAGALVVAPVDKKLLHLIW